MNPVETRTDLVVLLRIVWDEIMLLIVNILENALKLKRRSRIWLCPTSEFMSIPSPCSKPILNKGKEPCLEDIYICSYTPTLSALVSSRQTTKRRVTPFLPAVPQFLAMTPHELVHSKLWKTTPGCASLVMASRTLCSLTIPISS
jgi:hypothetical protein